MPLATVQYSDIDINFIPNPITGDIVKKTGHNSVVQSIMNLVQLNAYDKPFHAEVSSGVRSLLFELPDPVTAQQISQEIKNVIANFEPRATVIGVYVGMDMVSDGYNVTIEFSITGLTDIITVDVFLERIR